MAETDVTAADLAAALRFYVLQSLGLARFQQEILAGIDMGCVLVPATAHYSWDKGVAILGLGTRSLHHVDVDKDARMKLSALRAVLDRCLERQTPIVQLLAVAGSTAESAVDPIADILTLRAEYASKGLSLTFHADVAWGGYFTSMLRPPKDREGYTPTEPVSAHFTRHVGALRHVDTITVDPHKSGYLPCPPGRIVAATSG